MMLLIYREVRSSQKRTIEINYGKMLKLCHKIMMACLFIFKNLFDDIERCYSSQTFRFACDI